METFRVKAHVGKDGILKLELPVGAKDVDCDVTVTVNTKMTRQQWLSFIEETAGSLADDPIRRLPQGAPDVRDEIK